MATLSSTREKTYDEGLLREICTSEQLSAESIRHIWRQRGGCEPDAGGRVACDECRPRFTRDGARFYTLRHAPLRARAPLIVSTYALRVLSLERPANVADVELFGHVLHRPGGTLAPTDFTFRGEP